VLELLTPGMEERHTGSSFAEDSGRRLRLLAPMPPPVSAVKRLPRTATAVGARFMRLIPTKVLTLEQPRAAGPWSRNFWPRSPRGPGGSSTGPTGSGKSTTLGRDDRLHQPQQEGPHHLARGSDRVSCTRARPRSSNQREVGGHTKSFARALKGGPGAKTRTSCLVGEMRDLETIAPGPGGPRTPGHLVFATLHTNSAVSRPSTASSTSSPRRAKQGRRSARHVLGRNGACAAVVGPRPWVKKNRRRTPSPSSKILVVNLAISKPDPRGPRPVQIPSLMQAGKGPGA